MSYAGYGNSYTDSMDTVDEVADYTSMQGAASAANHNSQPGEWRSNPTKMLIVVWVVAVLLFAFLMGFFRRFLR